MSRKSNWVSLNDKFNNKPTNWKSRNLSFGGRLVLCKAVFSTMRSYLFSLFEAPSGVINRLKSTRCMFFGVVLQLKIKFLRLPRRKFLTREPMIA